MADLCLAEELAAPQEELCPMNLIRIQSLRCAGSHFVHGTFCTGRGI